MLGKHIGPWDPSEKAADSNQSWEMFLAKAQPEFGDRDILTWYSNWKIWKKFENWKIRKKKILD